MTSKSKSLIAALAVLGAIAGSAGAQDTSPADKPGTGPGMMGPGMMGPGMMGPGMMGPGMMGPGMMGPGVMGPGMMGPGGMMGRGMMGGACPMMGGPRSESYTAGRLAFLKAELAITDAQETAWKTYADALAKNLAGIEGMHERMQTMMSAKTPVERLEAHVAAMDERLAALKEMKPALSGLYDALDAKQKQKADDLLTGMGCMI